jgi:hypothetical protein
MGAATESTGVGTAIVIEVRARCRAPRHIRDALRPGAQQRALDDRAADEPPLGMKSTASNDDAPRPQQILGTSSGSKVSAQTACAQIDHPHAGSNAKLPDWRQSIDEPTVAARGLIPRSHVVSLIVARQNPPFPR